MREDRALLVKYLEKALEIGGWVLADKCTYEYIPSFSVTYLQEKIKLSSVRLNLDTEYVKALECFAYALSIKAFTIAKDIFQKYSSALVEVYNREMEEV